MSFWKKLFRKQAEEPKLTPEYIETLPSADDATFYRDSKRLLQRFDEYITSAEAESESLSIELDSCLEQQESIKDNLKDLDKPGSWHERHYLLQLDRLQLHSSNLMQRIEIYSQNIKIYLNLIAKIQDVKAMRMNGLDPDKIATIWVEFKETLEEYRDRVMTEASGFQTEAVTTRQLEERLVELESSIFPNRKEEEEETEAKIKPVEQLITAVPPRKSIEDLLDEQKNERFEDFEDYEEDEFEDDYEDAKPEALLE